ncbi:PAOX (predicted) [Pycnogonum litorale]
MCEAATTSKNPSVIVIGAGISGISCACRLREHGFCDVTILEARNRIGGRIHTEYDGDLWYELGAQYIHGQVGNPVYDLAETYDLIEQSRMSVVDEHKFNLPAHLEVFVQRVCQFMSDYEDEVSDIYTNADEAHKSGSYPLSYGHKAVTEFKKHIDDENNQEKRKVMFDIFDWHMKYTAEFNAAEPMELSALYYGNYQEFSGYSYTELKNGYQSLLHNMHSQLSNDSIKLGSCVDKIDWSNKQVKLKMTDGLVYTADHVVITLPLGVLKQQHLRMFTPNLPVSKVNAINHIGFGYVGKIYVRFDEPFWLDGTLLRMENYIENNGSCSILMRDGLNYQGRPHEDGYCDSSDCEDLENTWHRYVVRFCPTLGDSNALCAWIIGSGCKYAEKLPDDAVAQRLHYLLQKHFKDIEIPVLKVIARSLWCNDPYSYGSYSYLSRDCDVDGTTSEQLAEPLYTCSSTLPSLLFAGEATHENMFSTTHGALMSGQREADRLNKLYQVMNG